MLTEERDNKASLIKDIRKTAEETSSKATQCARLLAKAAEQTSIRRGLVPNNVEPVEEQKDIAEHMVQP